MRAPVGPYNAEFHIPGVPMFQALLQESLNPLAIGWMNQLQPFLMRQLGTVRRKAVKFGVLLRYHGHFLTKVGVPYPKARGILRKCQALLGLPERALDLNLLGDIFHNGEEVLGLVVLISYERSKQPAPNDGPVLAYVTFLFRPY